MSLVKTNKRFIENISWVLQRITSFMKTTNCRILYMDKVQTCVGQQGLILLRG